MADDEQLDLESYEEVPSHNFLGKVKRSIERRNTFSQCTELFFVGISTMSMEFLNLVFHSPKQGKSDDSGNH